MNSISYPVKNWLWLGFTVVSLSLWYVFGHYAFAVLGGIGAYNLFMMDLFDVVASAFSAAAHDYESESYGVIEDAEAELIEEMAEESERTVLNSHLFAKRMKEFEQ